MAASRSTRVTRSSVGINGLDENFCGRTLRNRSIAQPEDSLPVPLPRARSPKKKQDCQQQGALQQSPPKGSHAGKVADLKQPQAERETWMSPRKRGLSGSERDCPDKQENCEQRAPPEASPVPKRARCLSRSGGGPGPEDDQPAKPEGPSRDSRAVTERDDDPKPAGHSPRCEEQEVERPAVPGEARDQPVCPNETHKVTNGIDEQSVQGSEGCDGDATPNPAGPSTPSEGPCDAAGDPPLPNGSQADPHPALEPDVPCRNSHHGKTEPEGPREPSPPPPVAAQGAPPVREAEEEVDVVGESTNGGLCAAQDRPHISGEAHPLPEGSPADTEPQEHRYALRTSPRRGKGSPTKTQSPSTDNGLKEEDGGVLPAEPPAPRDARPTPGQREAKPGGELELVEGGVCRSTKEPAGCQAPEEEEEEDEDPDVYYFESDHLALKHNKDYQRLLQTIGVLEAQRTQAILDLETLARHQKRALGDPIGFVEQLQKQVEVGLPCPQRVVQLPDIAWDQYTSGLGDFEREFRDKKRNTRRMKLIFDKVGLPTRPKSPLDSKKEGESSALYSALPSSDAPEHTASCSRTQMIRGRMCDQNKPDTFNQLWTVEEQKKLEQLLLKFPPEEVESKRWQKIADELGNRTAKQVASRVQKYFIKLTKAGIPVPGRTPNLCMYSKKASSKRQHHLNKHLYRPSTFLTSYEPPVYMDDEDDRSSFYSGTQDPAAVESDEESIPVECRHLPEYKELLELKKLKKLKLQELHAESVLAPHMGYKCDSCGVEPIQGVRWHCQDCPHDNAVDFCANCSDCFHKTETHKPNHRLEPVYEAETFLDRDYCLPQSVGYNYLDPNYFPANR